MLKDSWEPKGTISEEIKEKDQDRQGTFLGRRQCQQVPGRWRQAETYRRTYTQV